MAGGLCCFLRLLLISETPAKRKASAQATLSTSGECGEQRHSNTLHQRSIVEILQLSGNNSLNYCKVNTLKENANKNGFSPVM